MKVNRHHEQVAAGLMNVHIDLRKMCAENAYQLQGLKDEAWVRLASEAHSSI